MGLLEVVLQRDNGVLAALLLLLHFFVREQLLLAYHVLALQLRLKILVVVLEQAHLV